MYTHRDRQRDRGDRGVDRERKSQGELERHTDIDREAQKNRQTDIDRERGEREILYTCI